MENKFTEEEMSARVLKPKELLPYLARYQTRFESVTEEQFADKKDPEMLAFKNFLYQCKKKPDELKKVTENFKIGENAVITVTEEASDSESSNELHSETGTMTHFASETPQMRRRFAPHYAEKEEEASSSAS